MILGIIFSVFVQQVPQFKNVKLAFRSNETPTFEIQLPKKKLSWVERTLAEEASQVPNNRDTSNNNQTNSNDLNSNIQNEQPQSDPSPFAADRDDPSTSIPRSNSEQIKASNEAIDAGNKKNIAEINGTTIKAEVKNNAGEETDIDSNIEQIADNKVKITLGENQENSISPGKYTLNVEIKDEGGETSFIKQDFTWGVLTINSNKSVFAVGDEAYLQMGVLKDDGHTICDATLKLEIRNPKSETQTLSTENKTIEKSGQCQQDNVVLIPDYFSRVKLDQEGTYELKLTNLDNGYEITDQFEVKNNLPFDVERIGPTRINPASPYEMKIKIKTKEDFQGNIIEHLPSDFIADGKKEITWNADFKANETYEFSYQFDAPDNSPYIYLLGPLEVTNQKDKLVFQESRQWQIASDAVPVFVTGAEAGIVAAGSTATNLVPVWNTVTGTAPTADTTTFRNGFRAYRFNPSSAQSALSRTYAIKTIVGRVAIRFASLPAANTVITQLTDANGNLMIRYINSGTKLQAQVGAGTVRDGPVIVANTWYVIEFSANTTAATATLDWRVDGVAQTQATNAQATLNMTAFVIGIFTSTSADMYADDIMISLTGADYPLGDGKVVPLIPNISGAHSFTVGDFRTDLSVNIAVADTTVAHGLVDEVPFTTNPGDYIKQIVIRGTGYVRIGFTDTTETIDARAVEVVSAQRASSTAAMNATMNLDDGGTLSAVYPSSDISQTTLIYDTSQFATPPSGGTWTAAKINALAVRWGYAGDITPNPYLNNVMLEVEYPIISIYGNAYQESAGSPYEGTTKWSVCDGSTLNISLSVGGGAKISKACSSSNGEFYFGVARPGAADNDIVVFLDTAGGNKGALYTHNNDTTTPIKGLTLFKDRLWIQSESATSITHEDIDSYDKDNDADIPVTVTQDVTDDMTVDSGVEMHIPSGETFAFASGLATLYVDKLHIIGTYSGGTEGLTLTGAGSSSTCDDTVANLRPLCIDSGSFTEPSYTYFTGAGASLIEATTYNDLYIQPGANSTTHTLNTGTVTANGLLTLGDGTYTSVIIDAYTNSTTVSATGNFTISGNTEFKADDINNLSVGGNWANSGTFTHNSNTVVFNASGIGRTINSGGTTAGKVFNTIQFNNSAGGWTIQTNNLKTANLTVTDVSAWALAASITLEVTGTYSIVDAETSATTWNTGSILYLNGTSQTIGSKTQTAETYATLQVGLNTDIRMWNSTATTFTVDATGSLYSQDHANVDGDLYIWGDYHTLTNDYWSYANDFDNAVVTRQVDVRIDPAATITVDSGDTLAAIGITAPNRTSISRQGASNGYGIVVAGGTINFQYADFDYLDGPNGIDIQASSTVTSLDNTKFDNLVATAGTDAFIYLVTSVIGAAAKTISAVQIDNTGSGANCNVNRTGTDTAGYWDFDLSTGLFDGETYDCKDGANEANPGQLRWDDSTTNTAPNSPSSLAQKKTDDTVIAQAGWTNETSVKYTATASDTDNPDTLYLCIEKDAIGTAFSNTEDSCGTGVAYSGTPVTVTHTIASQTDNTEYHWQARVKDTAGAYSGWVCYGVCDVNARDYGIDTTAPTGGSVVDGTDASDDDYNDGSLSSLSAYWTGTTPDSTVSGLLRYEYAIGTTQGGIDTKTWTDNGTATTITSTGLTLRTSQMYYFSVRAVDNATNIQSPPIYTNGQYVLPTLSFVLSTNTITFANLNNVNNNQDTKTMTVTTSTNGYNGYQVKAYRFSTFASVPYPTNTIPDFQGGSWATPGTWPAGQCTSGSDCGFGYTSSDPLVEGSNRFVSGTKYAPFSATASGDTIADNPGPISGTPITNEAFTITAGVAVAAIQAASLYQTQVVFIATANF